jgi:hypothetical protein
VFRNADNRLYVFSDNCGASYSVGMGIGTPFVGDFDGDGVDEPGYMTVGGGIYVIYRNRPYQAFNLGAPSGVKPAIGDYDNDLISDIAVFDPGTGRWYVRTSSTGTVQQIWFGTAGDVAVPGNYDGAGTNIAVWRPSTGDWFIRSLDGSTYRMDNWGIGWIGDVPVPTH